MLRPPHLPEDLVVFDEFCQLVADGQKADLLDGVIYMASPDSLRSDGITNLVHFLIEGFVGARGIAGRVLGSRFAFRLSETRAPEPDVAYVVPERIHLLEERGMLGGPDIAVEIVARESRSRDYVEKRRIYEEAGVREYWIIDPLQARAEFLRLGPGGYGLVPLQRNRIFVSDVISGFWIDTDWLLARPIPTAHDCLRQILSGEPK